MANILASEFPYAIHVFPLHLWKSIQATGRLLSKQGREAIGLNVERRSSAEVDRVLGFTEHVHSYLSRDGDVKEATMLTSKLKRRRPFPHLALRIDTRNLPDADCTVCAWNIARSRPGVGLWPPGSSPAEVRREWDAFRESRVPFETRKGNWVAGLAVPTLTPRELVTNAAFRKNGGELLLRSPFVLDSADLVLWSFSPYDSRSLMLLGDRKLRLVAKVVPGYTDADEDPVHPDTRAAIEAYFRDPDADVPDLDFD
jgi:hypothetical protein